MNTFVIDTGRSAIEAVYFNCPRLFSVLPHCIKAASSESRALSIRYFKRFSAVLLCFKTVKSAPRFIHPNSSADIRELFEFSADEE